MSYATGEAAILALIQTCSGFDTTNTSQSKWKMLNSGRASGYVILRPGKFTVKALSMGIKEYTWVTMIQVWERYKNDGTAVASLISDIAAITATLEANRFLGLGSSVILRSRILEGSDILEMWTKGSGPQWLRQDITLEWAEEVAPIFVE